jgi:mono/diheme cytochrome c family protein
MGKELYESNCAPCHGADGTGGLGKDLHTNTFIQSKSDDELIKFMLTGRPGTAMDGFEGILTPEELVNVVALIRAWQK